MSHIQTLIKCLSDGGTIFIAGNGGSAAQASHFAAELVVRYRKNRKPLSCICLNSDTAILTACANDFGYQAVFSRQLEAYAKPGDCVILLTTSGRSPNIIKAAQVAETLGVIVIQLYTGNVTSAVQEGHLEILHQWAEEIENAFV